MNIRSSDLRRGPLKGISVALKDIYEGDMPDLKDAKALLAELA